MSQQVQARGFALIEVLVSVAVLAVGVLGASAMQLVALRVQHESLLLTNATNIAASTMERMRANPGQIPSVYLTLDYDAHAASAPPAPASQCWSAACDAAALALADIHDVKRQVAAQLPSGRVRICRDAGMWDSGRLRWDCTGGAGSPVVVKIGWRGKNPDGTPARDGGGGHAPGVALSMAGGAP